HALAPDSRVSPAEFQAALDQSPLLHQFESGDLTSEEFFAEIQRRTGYRGSLDRFAGGFADIFEEIPVMVALQRELRRRGIPTYIFSNTNDLAARHVRDRYPFFAGFDGYVFSYQVGAMKPRAKIYEALEALAGAQGADLLYLDDRLENVEAGAVRGWRTIHHTDHEASARQVAGLFGWSG
ncbi:MAG: HAD family hydrolase, partial [Verrucomicrobiota bacterium]